MPRHTNLRDGSGQGDGRKRTWLTVDLVDEGRLAKGVGTLGGRVTEVITGLRTTDSVIGIYLVGLGDGSENKRRKRSEPHTIPVGYVKRLSARGSVPVGSWATARAAKARAAERATRDICPRILGGKVGEGRAGDVEEKEQDGPGDDHTPMLIYHRCI